MIPLLTRQAARAIDQDAVTRLGLPSLVLMENAGRGAFQAMLARFGSRLRDVLVVGGSGQNGGDAWVVARLLVTHGYAPKVLIVGEPDGVRGDAAVMLRALQALGVAVAHVTQGALSPLLEALKTAVLVVDGLFGTGLDRPVAGVHAQVIELINRSALPIVALDLPSGVDADTGAVLGVSVRASLTITFAAYKRGLAQHPAAALAGEVVCVDIGVPASALDDVGIVEAADVARLLPPRALDTHKGDAGRVLIVAGAPGRTGAALLAGLGALRAGAGLVTLCPRAGARAALDAKVIELMTADLPESTEPAHEALLRLASETDALVLGPGFGCDAQARELSIQLARECGRPMVLDADALTALSDDLSRLNGAQGPRVLTPHPGEAARLLGTSSGEIQRDRYAAAASIAQRSGCVVVLKGARTVVADPAGRVRVCARGTPALGVAGTGDVLGGVIGALLCQLPPPMAALAGVYLHASAGELAASADRGLFAREVADAIPAALVAARAAMTS